MYTYQLNNTKYHDDDNENNKLEGAGFRLYSGEACNDEDEIKLKRMLTALTLATLELKMAKKCSLTTRASLTLRVWTPVLTT